MEYRAFDINLTSLEGLKPQHYSLFQTRFYAAVSLVAATSISTQKSPLGEPHGGGEIHSWNSPMRFYADESRLQQNSITLKIQLRRRRALCMDKDVGEVYVPLKDLYDKSLPQNDVVSNSCPNNNNIGVYRVVTASRKYNGHLSFSFTFGGVFRGAVRRDNDDEASTLRRSQPVAQHRSALPSAPYVGTDPDNNL